MDGKDAPWNLLFPRHEINILSNRLWTNHGGNNNAIWTSSFGSLPFASEPEPDLALWSRPSSRAVVDLFLTVRFWTKMCVCSILIDFHFSFKLMPCVVVARRFFCSQTTLFSSLLFYTPEQEESLLDIGTKYRYCISILNIDTEYCYCGCAL